MKHKPEFRRVLNTLILILVMTLNVSALTSDTGDTIKFYDGQSFAILGRYHAEKNYTRFPYEYKSKLREEVWNLGQHSAGISIRFRTNSPYIAVNWTVKNDNVMDHMAFTGIKGIDLYTFVDGRWKYINTGRVKGKTSEAMLFRSGGDISREFLLNLPLYDGVDSLSIGVKPESVITIPVEKLLIDKKPVVYYGSSITQGGCASRPGMAFTNILSRRLDRSFINMGFSGSGTFDLPVGEAMCESDAALYIIDCNPNTKTELIYDRAVELVKLIKQRKPDLPVLMIEAYYYVNGLTSPQDSENGRKNMELQRAYKTLKKSGIQALYYQKGDGMIGDDFEGTVDGVHPNDLGMMRIADSLEPVIRKIIK